MSIRFFAAALLLLPAATAARAESLLVDFGDLSLPPESSYNGSDGAGGFSSGGVFFRNAYNPTWGSWSGWSYSNRTDAATAGFTNQFSSFAGGDASGDGTYAVAFGGSPNTVRFDLPEAGPGLVATGMSAMFTNTTYAALSMRDGDAFSKKFGGATGSDPDFFLLTIVGFSEFGATGSVLGEVEVALADFRFRDDAQDYILDDWLGVDLSSLIGARSLGFRLTSSDVGIFGMNTPAYFAMDDFAITFAPPTTGPSPVVPEPASLAMLGVGLASAAGLARARRRRIG